jgi:hypothetical protein
MELTKVIAELRAERAAIDEALAALDRIARATTGKRRGRPPAWLAATSGAVAEGGGAAKKAEPEPGGQEENGGGSETTVGGVSERPKRNEMIASVP